MLATEAQQEEAASVYVAASEELKISEPYALNADATVLDVPRPRARRKVIAFPRPSADLLQEVHRLADPVLPEHPRILDVPEELEALQTTPFLDGLQFHPELPPQTRDAEHAELPLLPATVAQRLYAASLDCALVGIACGIFAAVVYKMLPKMTISKPLLLTAAIVPVLLWAVYQYVLLVYAAATAGMRMAGVDLKSFQGTAQGGPPAAIGCWAFSQRHR